MNRRQWLLMPLFTTIGAFVSGLWSNSTRSEAYAADVADLQETLENGLRARRRNEFAFIATVCQLVENDRMPRSEVMIAFRYSRKKRPFAPFPYFQGAAREFARRRGIRI